MADRIKVSPLWLVAGAVIVVVSVILAVLILPGMDTDLMLPYAIVGYVLTPFAASAVLVLVRRQDLRFQGNPKYARLDGRMRVKQVGLIAAISFVPALIHIFYIAGYVGSMLA